MQAADLVALIFLSGVLGLVAGALHLAKPYVEEVGAVLIGGFVGGVVAGVSLGWTSLLVDRADVVLMAMCGYVGADLVRSLGGTKQ